MQRKTALVVSGIITAFVMVVVVGLVQMSGRASAAQPVSLTLPGGQATLSGAGEASASRRQGSLCRLISSSNP
jgi:hypothetical protein